MTKKLPLIELTIDPTQDSFVSAIALVENPAVELDFLAFSKVKEQFAINEDKKELLGVALIPDKPIYRNSPETGEYACQFSIDTVRQIAQVYAQKGLFNATNIEHTEIPADSYVFQSYIVDEKKGMNAPKGIEAPNGSWIVGVKVNSDDVWSDIKAGKVKGFSVEGIFKLIDTNTTVNLNKQIEVSEVDTAVEDFLSAIECFFDKKGI
jgi:hypothetical protein